MEAVAGVEPTRRQRKNLRFLPSGTTKTAPEGGRLYVLNVLHADLKQIGDRAFVGLVYVADTLRTVFGISTILPLELTARLPGVAAVHPMEENATVSLEHWLSP